MIKSGEDFSNGGRVGDHTDGSHNLSKITSGNNGGGLIVDTNLETGGAPINELDGSLGLDGGNGSVNVLGDNVTSVHHGTSHILSVSGITLGHHVSGFEGGVGDFGNGELFMVSLFS